MSYTYQFPPLCQLTDVKAALRTKDSDDDDRIALAIDAATRQVQMACGRTFFQDTVPSAKWFIPDSAVLCEVDDFMTTSGFSLVTYPNGLSGTAITWDSGLIDNMPDYQLEPLNGMLNQQPWPYTDIRAVGKNVFPFYMGLGYLPNVAAASQALVKVTAIWGWSYVPADVMQATIIQSIAVYKSVDVPFGATPFGETGVIRMKVALHPTADMLLEDYTRRVMVG